MNTVAPARAHGSIPVEGRRECKQRVGGRKLRQRSPLNGGRRPVGRGRESEVHAARRTKRRKVNAHGVVSGPPQLHAPHRITGVYHRNVNRPAARVSPQRFLQSTLIAVVHDHDVLAARAQRAGKPRATADPRLHGRVRSGPTLALLPGFFVEASLPQAQHPRVALQPSVRAAFHPSSSEYGLHTGEKPAVVLARISLFLPLPRRAASRSIVRAVEKRRERHGVHRTDLGETQEHVHVLPANQGGIVVAGHPLRRHAHERGARHGGNLRQRRAASHGAGGPHGRSVVHRFAANAIEDDGVPVHCNQFGVREKRPGKSRDRVGQE